MGLAESGACGSGLAADMTSGGVDGAASVGVTTLGSVTAGLEGVAGAFAGLLAEGFRAAGFAPLLLRLAFVDGRAFVLTAFVNVFFVVLALAAVVTDRAVFTPAFAFDALAKGFFVAVFPRPALAFFAPPPDGLAFAI